MRNQAAPSACLGPAYTFKKQSRGLKYKKMLTGRNLVAAGISEHRDIFRADPRGVEEQVLLRRSSFRQPGKGEGHLSLTNPSCNNLSPIILLENSQ